VVAKAKERCQNSSEHLPIKKRWGLSHKRRSDGGQLVGNRQGTEARRQKIEQPVMIGPPADEGNCEDNLKEEDSEEYISEGSPTEDAKTGGKQQ